MRIILLTASLLALAACATPPAPAPVAAADPQAVASTDTVKMVCHRETPTGSTITHNVCERADAVQDHQLATDLANEAARNRPIVSHSGG